VWRIWTQDEEDDDDEEDEELEEDGAHEHILITNEGDSSLPTVDSILYSAFHLLSDSALVGKTCAICLSDLKSGHHVISLPCVDARGKLTLHTFHSGNGTGVSICCLWVMSDAGWLWERGGAERERERENGNGNGNGNGKVKEDQGKGKGK
jgi:hypothetical protein